MQVTVSPKYQVVIPKKVRESIGLSPGDKLQVVCYGDRIVLVPSRPIKSLRGSAPGIDTTVPRQEDRT